MHLRLDTNNNNNIKRLPSIHIELVCCRVVIASYVRWCWLSLMRRRLHVIPFVVVVVVVFQFQKVQTNVIEYEHFTFSPSFSLSLPLFVFDFCTSSHMYFTNLNTLAIKYFMN